MPKDVSTPTVPMSKTTVTVTGPKDFNQDPPPMRVVPFRDATKVPDDPEEIEDIEQNWMTN